MIESLKLVKVPCKIINAISSLTKSWSAVLTLLGENSSVITDPITFERGIFQGDTLSILLFILSVNSLSLLLKKQKGYLMGSNQNCTTSATHNFFVDDLKLYNKNINDTKKQLELVTTFSNDINMKFGEEKCAYLVIERGKIVNHTEKFTINGLSLTPVTEVDSYTYLGQDENISYCGNINKERVTKENYNRVKKIWRSQLSAYNKYISHNAFAVAVLIPTFGIFDWTLEEIQAIDIRTRKTLTMTGNFHRNSDIDRLYLHRKNSGRGLKSIKTAFECRIISLKQHLEQQKTRNDIMQKVYQNESTNIIRVANELIQKHDVENDTIITPRQISQEYAKKIQIENRSNYHQKVMHGYISRKNNNDSKIDLKKSLSWTCDKYLTSEFEAYAYAFAIQEQKLQQSI